MTESDSRKARSGLYFAVLFALMGACGHVADPLPGFPKLVLWAWERPENLQYIAPASTGIAFLAETIRIGPGGTRIFPRAQPLWAPERPALIAVIRIEAASGSEAPAPSAVARQIVSAVRGLHVRAVQIDFDATVSQRGYYLSVMRELRGVLPPPIALEMTALVSWCERDDWIGKMPVVEAVPMFFQMGVDPHSPRERLREPLCAASVGISTGEFYVPVTPGKRVFVFNTQPWTEASYRAVLRESAKWR